MSLSDEEFTEFKQEALELLEGAESSLLVLDKNPEQFIKITFDAVFRAFHSLKGAAGMMELTRIQGHTHELETILMAFKGKTELPQEYVSLFLRGIDATRTMLDGKDVDFDYSANSTESKIIPVTEKLVVTSVAPISSPVKSSNIPEEVLKEFVDEGQELLERLNKNMEIVEREPLRAEVIDEIYRDIHSLKGSAFLFSFNHLGSITHAMETSLESVRGGAKSIAENLMHLLLDSLKLIEEGLQKVKLQGQDEDIALAVKALVGKLSLLPNENLEKSNHPSSFKASIEKTIDSPADVSREADHNISLSSPGTSAKLPHNQGKDAEQSTSIRVSVSLLDSLMTLMGEMVLVRNQVLQFSNNSEDLELLSMSKRLNVVTSEIQAEMMKTRMQPIGNVISKFTRVVRDLSHELKKNIQLQLMGTETEVDKSLLEAIKDPLTHIVRNSCDHGIELPEIRKAAGKSETGTIHIRSYHEGGQVVVEVADDGKGLNADVLLSKAIEKGIVTQAQASKMSEKEIFNLIFAPGFSTASKVTNLSGRGVGMDVVRTNVEKIGGTIDMVSQLGKGTTIKLKIPLTLAIVPALIVRCGQGLFAIPQVKLEELLRVDHSTSEVRIEMIHGSPVYRLRGSILPLIDLNKILGIKNQNTPGNYNEGIVNIAVLNNDKSTFGVIIDEVQDTADIVVKPLNRLLKSLQVYSGATILGDGAVALIFDVLGISKLANIENEKTKDEQDRKLGHSDSSPQHGIQKHYLLVKLNSNTRHAIPLESVHRLEEFLISQVEMSGFQRVIRYRDIILPLIDTSAALGYGARDIVHEKIPVIVINQGNEYFGMEVTEILDTLSTSTQVVKTSHSHLGISGNLNLKEELVVVVDPKEVIEKSLQEITPTSKTDSYQRTHNHVELIKIGKIV